MLEEALILDCKNGPYQVGRDFVEWECATLSTLNQDIIGQHFRLECE